MGFFGGPVEPVEAQHVRQTIFRSDLHFSHDMSEEIDRLVFDVSYLSPDVAPGPFVVAYFWEGTLGAYFLENGKELSKAHFREVRKVSAPYGLFSAALELASLQRRVKALRLEEAFTMLTDDAGTAEPAPTAGG
jgi:hypothetical protein